MKVREFPKVYEENLIFSYTYFKSLTNLLNALSLTFPEGERFFIRAVRAFEEQYSEALKEDCKVFYKQEAQHSMQHQKLNSILQAKGVPVKELERQAKELLESVGKTPEEKLIVTHCLEIITGFGGWLLPKIQTFIMKDNNLCYLWEIHAIEEKEHVHVAENALKETFNTNSFKIFLYFVVVSYLLIKQTTKNYKEVLKASKRISNI